MSDIPVKTESEGSNTSNIQPIPEGHDIDYSATRIANAWRYHRKTREEEGKILSANSRDQIRKSGSSCLHLPGQTCPVWSQWEELLNAVQEHLHRKEILKEPPSSTQKLELAMTVVERIAKGSSSVKDHLWLILDTEHWLEICDEKHRYGSNLKVYHDFWLETSVPENFFEWLDNGSGKDLDLPARPRKLLDSQLVKYLTAKELAEHEVTFKDGLLIYSQSGKPVHTNPPDPDTVIPEDSTQNLSIPNTTESRSLSPAPSSQGSLNEEIEGSSSSGPMRRDSTEIGPKREKWIYVTDCRGKFYVGQKIKGYFHHSSFLAGGAIQAAGGIKARQGKLLEINPNSGHYKPAQHHFNALIERLKSEGINLSDGDVKVVYPNENLEKRLMAKYKFKRLAAFSMVYDDLMRDASSTINRKIDFMERYANIFKKQVAESINACKESIKDWFQQIIPGENNMKRNHIPDNDQQNGLVR
ncbi:hypothetical protein RclHR1_00350016 [Rhizophagus clarus]|uniref:IQ domain-containing protein IQM5-like n=1 Tax=Rhizophagus clarus TaxID=94130 RepID=A0A2Z6RBQ1_9GLOM|nr:hypothetical protein RclHR1_00350016 [Rhizophagus clarus]GES88444.1 IQ domain-containing protein IQM5-like [Rhizophagus clarus]